MNRFFALSFLSFALVLPVIAQDFDYREGLAQIQTNIESGDFSGALEINNKLREFLKGKIESPDPSVSSVSATELFASFLANEQKAKKKYQAGTWVISGRVTKIGSTYDQHFDTVPAIIMSVDNYGIKGVTFAFTEGDADRLSDLSIGDEIKIQGRVGAFQFGLTLNVDHCQIVE